MAASFTPVPVAEAVPVPGGGATAASSAVVSPSSSYGGTMTRVAAAASYHHQPHPANHNNSNGSSQQQTPVRFVRAYQSGFSTSICDLFSNPYNRADFCALALCGIFLQDRNNYVVNGTLPPPWWKRLLINVLLFVVVLVIGTLFLGAGGIVVAMVAVGIRGTLFRMRFRKQLMTRLEQERQQQQQPSGAAATAASEVVLVADDSNMCAPHRRPHRCCGFVGKDTFYVQQQQQEEGDGADEDGSAEEKDFCFNLWRFIAASCCGWMGCWCQCCGMCATGQEDREIRRLYPKEKFLMDYVTMQPYREYYPAIENLRRIGEENFWAHLKAMSRLSTNLVRVLEVFLLILLGLTILLKQLHLTLIIVVLGTLLQAFVVVYIVHWKYHRFDISLDLVVKHFASGFIIAMPVAVGFELLAGAIGNIIFVLLMRVEYGIDNPAQITNGDNDDLPSDKEVTYDIVQHHLPTMLAFLFFQAFIVAALIEEITKFFSFWIVEHPDLNFIPGDLSAEEEETAITSSSSSFDEEGNEQQVVTAPPAQRTIHSKSAAMTIGLVTTAAGFACVENLMYCVGAGSTFSKEITVLLARAALPVHPICAALQSIGFVQRDIEGDASVGFGRAILPAVILHGTFDFIVMAMAVIDSNSSPPPPDEDSADGDDDESGEVSVKSMVVGIAIVCLGLFYYFMLAQKQRERLNALESTTAGAAVRGSSLL